MRIASLLSGKHLRQINSDEGVFTIREKKNKKRMTKDGKVAAIILTPMLMYFVLFSVVPIIGVVGLSLSEWNGLTTFPTFVGLRNYVYFFQEKDYIITLLRAGMFGFVILFFNIVFGFLTALLLNRNIRGVGIIRTLWYLPVLVPFSVVSQMLSTIINPVDGVLTKLMLLFTDTPIIFQTSTFWMSFWIILITVWKGIGGTVIIFLAGLQSVDQSLYEAARVDGANKGQLMFKITIPSMRPMTMFVLITGIIGSFLMFEPVKLISQGGPYGTTNTIIVRIFQDAFNNFNFGMASASSVIVLIVTLILSITQFRIAQKSNTE